MGEMISKGKAAFMSFYAIRRCSIRHESGKEDLSQGVKKIALRPVGFGVKCCFGFVQRSDHDPSQHAAEY